MHSSTEATVLKTSFSCGNEPVAVGETVTQTISAQNPHSCDCLVIIKSELSGPDDAALGPGTTHYDGDRVTYTHKGVLQGAPRRKSRRLSPGGRRAGAASSPHRLELELPVHVGTPPAADARPYRVGARVTYEATESREGVEYDGALWDEDYPPAAAYLYIK
jgi:hypothetical protein